MSLIPIFALVLLTCSLSSATCTEPLVNTGLGWVQGANSTSRGGRTFAQFLGIPYAKAPTGSLRFKSPVSPDPWVSVLNATKECSDCIQQYVLIESVRTVVSGSEDCLCLNVFTPNVSSSAKLPVIVFVHGGAYVGGSGATALYGPELFLDKDVVLVTFNYRLGIMGFISTADEVIPGNFGMKDQAHALRWVNENIRNFGGDPDSITLMGESAGATSVSLHQYSPLSKDLFHKAIQESGSALNPWAMIKPEVLKGKSAVVAEMLGCTSTESAALLECLQDLPAETIVNTTHKLLIFDLDPLTIWAPTIEVCSFEDAFLTEDPKDWIENSTKPLLVGFNGAEGGLKTTTVVGSLPAEKFARWNKEYDTLTPISLMINNTELDRPAVTKAMRKFYFGSARKPITPDMLQQITKLYGDNWFNFGILDEVERRSGETYLYHYNYNKTFSACPLILLGTPTPYVGACHFDELTNFFPVTGLAPKFNTSDPDYLLSVKMVDLWTTFARNSEPSTSDIKWKPVSSKALEHLEITNSGIFMKSEPIKERRAFWKSIPDIEDIGETTVIVSITATKDTSETASATESKGIVVPVVSNLLGTVLGILG